jgi:hypothetical protein
MFRSKGKRVAKRGRKVRKEGTECNLAADSRQQTADKQTA